MFVCQSQRMHILMQQQELFATSQSDLQPLPLSPPPQPQPVPQSQEQQEEFEPQQLNPNPTTTTSSVVNSTGSTLFLVTQFMLAG